MKKPFRFNKYELRINTSNYKQNCIFDILPAYKIIYNVYYNTYHYGSLFYLKIEQTINLCIRIYIYEL